MEKADNIVMVTGDFGWDDVGSWPALANHFSADANGNVVVGDCIAVEARDSIVVSKGHLTALLGVKDLIVVHAPNATLVCRKDRAQDVKRIVQLLQSQGGHEDLL